MTGEKLRTAAYCVGLTGSSAMFRTIIVTGLIAIMAGGPAAAQAIPTGPSGPRREQIEKEKREEEAAKRAMGDVPERKASKDPWGNLRQAPTSSNAGKKSH
jgi:hypothetical protein